jgi:GGDEF domain-containing protein
VGIAIFPDDSTDMESLCIAADLRMYDNKHQAAATENATPPPNQAHSNNG